MIDRTSEVVFTACNHHIDSGPHVNTADWGRYRGYFEGDHGDQWIFVYDYKTKSATLTGGDVAWGVYPVTDGEVPRLCLSKSEKTWLTACWWAAAR